MPPGPIVDSHVHLWDPYRFRMPWLDNEALLNRPHGVPEYREHTAGIEIAAMVYVQVEVAPPYALMEAHWAVERAREEPRLKAIVPWAPLEYGDQSRAFLSELQSLSPLIKGIRRIIEYEPDPTFCLQPGFIRGVELLPEYGFSFDINVNYRHLANTIELVRRCPSTNFVLDHLGKPDIAHQGLVPWRDQIRELASFPNVMCKLSGMVTETDRMHWTADDLAPFAEHVLLAFGEDRVMFGGDWPVVLLASQYTRWVETADRFIGQLSPEWQRNVWSGNARRFYRIADA